VREQADTELLHKDDLIGNGVIEQGSGSAEALETLPIEWGAPSPSEEAVAQAITHDIEKAPVANLAMKDVDGVPHFTRRLVARAYT
jgi:hypothetical protein